MSDHLRFVLGKNHKDEILGIYGADVVPRGPLDQTDIPLLAKDPKYTSAIDELLPTLPTFHRFVLGDSTRIPFPEEGSVHLVLTSPPYWTLKEYQHSEGQMGDICDYDDFSNILETLWRKCYACLCPGGRLVVVVGDVCLSRRQNNGRHMVIRLHATIQESCRKLGYDVLAPIIWHKIANANYEAGGGGFLGKPYEPNCVIKNDIEFILMFRKPGGYRKPTDLERRMSIISEEKPSQMVPADLVGGHWRFDPKSSCPLS